MPIPFNPVGGTAKFRTQDINRELGVKREEAASTLLQLSLSRSSEYIEIRRIAKKNVVNDLNEFIYTLVYNALGDGVGADGVTKLVPLNKASLAPFRVSTGQTWHSPMFPEKDIHKIAEDMTADFKAMLDKHIINNILPPDLHDQAMGKITQKTVERVASGDTRV